MIEKKLTVLNSLGIHVRPASLIAKEMLKFTSEVTIEYNGETADCKSMLAVMVLSIACNKEVIVYANGEDEELAINDISELFNSKFGEE